MLTDLHRSAEHFARKTARVVVSPSKFHCRTFGDENPKYDIFCNSWGRPYPPTHRSAGYYLAGDGEPDIPGMLFRAKFHVDRCIDKAVPEAAKCDRIWNICGFQYPPSYSHWSIVDACSKVSAYHRPECIASV